MHIASYIYVPQLHDVTAIARKNISQLYNIANFGYIEL